MTCEKVTSFRVFNPGVEIMENFLTGHNFTKLPKSISMTMVHMLFTVVHFTYFCLCVCSVYSHFEFKLKKEYLIYGIQNSKYKKYKKTKYKYKKSIRKLNNPTAKSFLSVFRFNLQYILNVTHWYTPFLTKKLIKKPCGQGFFGVYFCVICLVRIQKLKQPMISIKIMAKNLSYCGFQGQVCTEKMTTY